MSGVVEEHRARSSGTRRTLLALVATALAALPLKALLDDSGWLVDAWLTMAVVVAPAALLRIRRAPSALDIWPGIILLVPWLTRVFVPQHAWGGVIPTGATFDDVSRLMDSLHRTTSDEVAPIHSTLAVRLVICALLGLLAALIDLIAVAGRRAALAGVPLLVVYTVSGAVPRNPVAWGWFAAAAIGYLILLSLDAADEVREWGRRIPRRGGVTRGRTGLGFSAQRIGMVAILAAVIVPFAVPDHPRNLIADAFHNGNGTGLGGFGAGSGGGGISPFAALKGQLARNNPVPLVTVHISAVGPVQPFYLRSNVLDTFTGSGWRVNPNGHGNTERLALSPSLDVTPTVSAPRTVSYQADITVTGLTGNAPIFAVPRAVEGLDATTDWTPTDLLLINSSVHRGQEYVENVAQPDPTQDQLNAEPAVDLPDMQRWLELPSGVPAYVTNLVHRITAGRTTPYERARAISDWFANPANGFVYSLHTKQGDSGNDLVDFLHNRSGFCQQYAAAMGVMLRVADVPSRLVLGYMHNPPDASGNFTITTFDAHAWVEAFFPGVGWTPFDPTPADGLVGGQRTDLAWAPHVYASASAAAPSVSKNLNTPQPSGSGSTPAQQTSGAAHNSFPLGPVVWTVVAVLGLMLIGLTPALVRGIRRRRRYAAARRGDPDPLWEELSDTAVDLGYVWSPARTPRQVSTWLSRDAADTAPALHALAIAVEQRRYAPDAAPPDAAALARGLQDVTDQLRSVRRGRVRLSSRIWPASLGWGRQLRWMRTAVRRRH